VRLNVLLAYCEASRCRRQLLLQYFGEAEKVHPPGNDDAILRWNRCVRLLQSQPDFEAEEVVSLEAQDGPPA